MPKWGKISGGFGNLRKSASTKWGTFQSNRRWAKEEKQKNILSGKAKPTSEKVKGLFQRKPQAAAAAPTATAAQPQIIPAAAPSAGGGGPSVSSLTGFTSGRTMFAAKQVGKTGLWIGLALMFVMFLFAMTVFIGGIFAAIPLYWLVIIIGILLFVVLLFKGKASTAVMILIIFVGLGYGAWYMQYTPLGKQMTAQLQVGGVGAVGGLQALTGPLNIMGQMFTGTYNVENTWSSDVVQSQYETVKDVGVVLSNVKSVRDKYDVNQQLVVQGRINAVAFPGQTATAELSAKCITASLIPGVIECINPSNWDCEPKFTNIKAIRDRVFSCTHDGQACEVGQTCVYAVEVTARAVNTMTVAGKQFVFANPDVAVTLDNPLSTWKISRESLKSWQKGDQSLNLGIGVVNEPDYLEAGSGLDYYLGVNIENPASNSGTANMKGIHFFVPKALFNNNCANGGGGDFNTCKDAGDLSKLGIKEVAQLCDCEAGIASNDVLKPGDRRTALLRVLIDKNQLNNATFGTFFTLATAKYDYTNTAPIPLTVENMGGSGGVTGGVNPAPVHLGGG